MTALALLAQFTAEEKASVQRAMRAANPDIDGDLIRKLGQLSPSAAEKMRRIMEKLT